jgi:hypothetical protein
MLKGELMNKQQRLHELKVRQKELTIELDRMITKSRFVWTELYDITEEINEVESELDYE